MKENAPLSVTVKNGKLVISIGVNVLAGAVAAGDDFHVYDDATNDYLRSVAISGPEQFAKDVALAMQSEAEDGSSPLTKFLDQMAQDAIDDGSTGCEYDQRIKFGERHESEGWFPASPANEGATP